MPRSACVMVCVLLSAGCYKFEPVDMATPPPPGTEVRAHLSRAQARDLTVETGRDFGTVEAEVVEWGEEDVVLRVPFGTAGQRVYQQVIIPPWEIEEVERKRFDALATGAIVAGVVGAGLLAREGLVESQGIGDSRGPGEEIESIVVPVPLFRIAVP